MPRTFPEPDANERDLLTDWLDWQRATVRSKVEGLGDADASRSLVPTSPRMTVAGVTSHLRWVEWWILGHMIEETARHLGHLDILRELTDGATGY